MDRVFSPKRLQKEGQIGEAIAYYKVRYHESLQDRDPFLSSLYLDEIAYSLIIGDEKLSYEQLHEGLVKAVMLESLDQELRQQAILDVEITLRKRFPGKFRETDSQESE